MAITFVNKNTLATGAGRTTSTLTAPASIADNDILIFCLLCDTNGTVTLPTGFTNFTGSPYNNAGYVSGAVWIFVAWKRASSESGNYSATHTSRSTAGFIAAYRGCITSGTPTDATPTTNQGTGTTATWTGVTTATNGTHLFAYGNGDTSAGASSSAGMTERQDLAGAPDSGMAYDVVQTTAGATGNKTATLVNSQNWMTFLVPLKIGGTTFTSSLAGSITGSGALAKQANKPFAGSSTGSGALTKLASKALAGTSTGAGALAKLVSKPFAGSSTASGALTTIKVVLRSFDGSITAAGALTKQAAKALAGSTTGAGALTKQAAKALSGSTTGAGALAKQARKAFDGSSTASGALSLVRAVLISLAGSITATGALTRSISKGLTGSLAPAGALAKLISKAFAGSSTAVGVLTLAGGSITTVVRLIARLLGLEEATLRRGGLNEPTLRADGEEHATIRRRGIDE